MTSTATAASSAANSSSTSSTSSTSRRTPGLRQHKLSLLVREEKVREDREEADGDDQFPS